MLIAMIAKREYKLGDTVMATFVDSESDGFKIIKKPFFVIASRKVRYGGKFDYVGTVKKTLYTVVETEGELRNGRINLSEAIEVDYWNTNYGRKLLSEKL